MSSAPYPVRVGACRCPGTPHPEDLVYLTPRLTLEGGIAATNIIAGSGGDASRVVPALMAAWVRYGVVGWSFVDEGGDPIPVTPATIDEQLGGFSEASIAVAEAADGLYSEALMRPLALRSDRPSQPGQIAPSTSASPSSPRKRQAHSA